MSRPRRVFGKEFKAKVALEALKEKETLEVLAKKYKLLSTQNDAEICIPFFTGVCRFLGTNKVQI